MSIVMIRGPEDPDPERSGAIPDAVYKTLSRCAADAGKALMIYSCGSEEELVERLRQTRRDNADIVLLDPGRCAQASERLRDALAQLQVQYIEVHDDRYGAMDPVIPSGNGPRAAVVNGYAAQSYVLAMWIALERIGCADCANDIHVGT